ncbi:MAG TPA: hypothetical protein VME42_02340 [Steroidobacteraceae bacterium]|nr:hypothetical protein [Steroidobacteraceae bacterium]
MRFRLKAFGLHLLGSASALSLTLGALYLWWYHWPGWYLADVPHVIAVLVGVDVVLGPLLTLIIASPRKPRRELARDIAMIVAVQLAALGYGATSLWNGRPLYYAFSENCLSIVQAYDFEPGSPELARAHNAALAPHWYSLPRWVWAPLPKNTEDAAKIMQSAIQGGFDVTARPQYYRPWADGAFDLRTQLKRIDDIKFFTGAEKKLLRRRMAAAGFSPDQANGLALTGRARPLLAVFDPKSLRILAYLEPN